MSPSNNDYRVGKIGEGHGEESADKNLVFLKSRLGTGQSRFVHPVSEPVFPPPGAIMTLMGSPLQPSAKQAKILSSRKSRFSSNVSSFFLEK